MSALDQYVPGQRVRAYWTNCNRDYEADGTITRVSAKTVRVDIDGATILKTGLEWENGKLTPCDFCHAASEDFCALLAKPSKRAALRLSRVRSVCLAASISSAVAASTASTRFSLVPGYRDHSVKVGARGRSANEGGAEKWARRADGVEREMRRKGLL